MKRLLLVSVVALAACQAGAPPESRFEPVAQSVQNRDDPCGAKAFEYLVGKPGDSVTDAMFPVGTRVLRPGMVMTMDYRGDRLNVVIDEAGQVDRVYCG